jgi:hypothetical protein
MFPQRSCSKTPIRADLHLSSSWALASGVLSEGGREQLGTG